MSQSISVSDRPRCNRHILVMSPEPKESFYIAIPPAFMGRAVLQVFGFHRLLLFFRRHEIRDCTFEHFGGEVDGFRQCGMCVDGVA